MGKIALRWAFRRRDLLLVAGALALGAVSIGGFLCVRLWLGPDLTRGFSSDGSLPVIVGLAGLLALSMIRQVLEQSFSAWSASHEPLNRNQGFPRTLPAQMLTVVTEIMMLSGLVFVLGRTSWQLVLVLAGLLITTYPMVRVAMAEYRFSPRIVDVKGNFLGLPNTRIRVAESLLCLVIAALLIIPAVVSIFAGDVAFGAGLLSDFFLWTLIILRGGPASIASLTLAIRQRFQSEVTNLNNPPSANVLSMIQDRRCLVVFLGLNGQFFGLGKRELKEWFENEFPGREVIFFQEQFRQWDKALSQAGSLSKSQNILTQIHRRAESVEYVGGSGGAFAAILHASVLRPSEVIAFFPPARIHHLKMFNKDGLPESKLTDLTKLNAPPPGLIIVGTTDHGMLPLHALIQQQQIASSLCSPLVVLEEKWKELALNHGLIARLRRMARVPVERPEEMQKPDQ